MWPELKREIAVEQESLERLLAGHRELMVRCQSTPPDQIEISALSAMLHSFYTGVENLFKRSALHLDQEMPHGEMWHSRLLDSMAAPTGNRPSVITGQLRDGLRDYLNFRHVFRHAYTFELRWSKMAPLVLGCERIYRQLEQELKTFACEMDLRHQSTTC